jgi:transcriptional regulator with XRE-family HTH domain
VGIELRGTRHLEQGTAWKRAREARGLSQRAVAAHLGVHRDTVRRWMTGQSVPEGASVERLLSWQDRRDRALVRPDVPASLDGPTLRYAAELAGALQAQLIRLAIERGGWPVLDEGTERPTPPAQAPTPARGRSRHRQRSE